MFTWKKHLQQHKLKNKTQDTQNKGSVQRKHARASNPQSKKQSRKLIFSRTDSAVLMLHTKHMGGGRREPATATLTFFSSSFPSAAAAAAAG